MESDELLELKQSGFQALNKGDYETALFFYKEAHEHTPDDADLLVNLAFSLYQLGRYEEASQFYRAALTNPMATVVALAGLSSSHVQMGRHKEAIESLIRVIELDPDNVGYYIQLAHVYCELHRYDAASDVITAAARRGLESSWLLVKQAVVATAKGDDEAAFDYYRHAIAGEASDINVLHAFAETALKLGKFEAARQAANQILLERPDNKEALYSLARAEYGLGQPEAAISAMKMAMKDDPQMFQRLVDQAKKNMKMNEPLDPRQQTGSWKLRWRR